MITYLSLSAYQRYTWSVQRWREYEHCEHVASILLAHVQLYKALDFALFNRRRTEKLQQLMVTDAANYRSDSLTVQSMNYIAGGSE